jgi:hypothetical protein
VSPREQAIRAGVLHPGSPQSTGGPTPLPWVDKPTLRLDRAAVRAQKEERERPRRDRPYRQSVHELLAWEGRRT